ncbi:hypothetical protein EW146_g2066 [Bondarzewia mesenterica]|uniref:Uncharacterized protein n=1 Tax=Bondarzewia mesenterica TaxID=1095465 RepID=A0A4V3XFW1_9AGAM|nr:hypothetical protein EW146_g2066 [Bondarzewia mesenterica]
MPEPTGGEYDPENATPSQGEPFDLREYLSSSNDTHERARNKHKHFGGTWEEFQVEIGGKRIYQAIYQDIWRRRMANMVNTVFHIDDFRPDALSCCQEECTDNDDFARVCVSPQLTFVGTLVTASETYSAEYSVCDEFFLPLNIRYENRWMDVWVVFCYFVFNFAITMIDSHLLRFARLSGCGL